MGYVSSGARDKVLPKDLPPIEEAIRRGGGVYECGNGQRFRARPAMWVPVKSYKRKSSKRVARAAS
jgi:hypothetical protein